MSGYERENRNVLRRCLKTASDGAKSVKFPNVFPIVKFLQFVYGTTMPQTPTRSFLESVILAYSHNGRAPKRPRTKKAARPLQPAVT